MKHKKKGSDYESLSVSDDTSSQSSSSSPLDLDSSNEMQLGSDNENNNNKAIESSEEEEEDEYQTNAELEEEEAGGKTFVVDQILGRRMEKDKTYSFLVKYKSLSYCHVEWRAEQDLRESFGSMNTRLTRMHKSMDRKIREAKEDGEKVDENNLFFWFDEKNTIAESILDLKKMRSVTSTSIHYRLPPARQQEMIDNGKIPKEEEIIEREAYLVKWTDLSYVNLTWEWFENVQDEIKVAVYKRVNIPPSGVLPKAIELNDSTASSSSLVVGGAVTSTIKSDRVLLMEREMQRKKFYQQVSLNAAANIGEPSPVPLSLREYIYQAEALCLLQVGDEIVGVNGERMDGRSQAQVIGELLKKSFGSAGKKMIRVYRREVDHEVEIMLNGNQRLGMILESPRGMTAANKGNNGGVLESVHVGNASSVFIEYFSQPFYMEKGLEMSTCSANVDMQLRRAVVSVFCARDLHLKSVAVAAREAKVEEEYFKTWLNRIASVIDADLEVLREFETSLRRWVDANIEAFSKAVNIGEVEAMLGYSHEGEKKEVGIPDQSNLSEEWMISVRNRLEQIKDEAKGSVSAFEIFAMKQLQQTAQLRDSMNADEIINNHNKSDNGPDEPEEKRFEMKEGKSPHLEQLKRIELIQSGRVRFQKVLPKTLANNRRLRDYQLEGLNWMLKQWYCGKNSILADEMGLGKTAQIVSFLDHLKSKENLRGPFLIVAPLSTLVHWKRELEAWSDLQVCFYYDARGSHKGREMIRQYEFYYEALNYRTDCCKFNVLLTSYETFLHDLEYLSKVPFLFLILDEGHRIKGKDSKLLAGMKQLRVNNKILLSGTPLQNNLTELWALLNFIQPNSFRDLNSFLKRFGDLKNKADLDALQVEIAPYMLRRVKEDVEKSIPAKEETIIDCDLSPSQMQYYRAIFERNKTFLYRGTAVNNRPQLNMVEMELRKCCNHPYLISGVREKEEQEEGKKESGLIDASGKMILVEKMLVKFKREGRKVLIFSQFIGMLDLLEEMLEKNNFQHERIDGTVHGNLRQGAIDRFCTAPDVFVFLLSTKAGGVGINLTAADTVIIFDSDFNPQNDEQAQARCHRIGQSKPVSVYRLITKHTYEECILKRAAKKLGLERAVIGGAVRGEEVSTKELELMLREGAYHHLVTDSGFSPASLEAFKAMDVEEILKMRARKIKVDQVRGGVSFELTHNTTNEKEEDGDKERSELSDPDFWMKILPRDLGPKDLLGRINDRDGQEKLKESQEERFQFLKRVKEIVDEVVEFRNAAIRDFERIRENEAMGETIVSLLTQLENMQSVFGKEAARSCSDMKLRIEATKQRRARGNVPTMNEEEKKKEETNRKELMTRAERRLKREMTRSSEEQDDEAEKQNHAENESEAEKDSKPKNKNSFSIVEANITERKKERKKKDPEPPPLPPYLPNDVISDFCFLCNDGGHLLLCEGKCRRGFHLECVNLPVKPKDDEEWKCGECVSGARACFLCGIVGEESAEKESHRVEQCCFEQDGERACGNFYHPSCLRADPRTKWLDEGKLAFVCPLHLCCVCGEDSGLNVICTHCPNAYHVECMDLKHTLRLGANTVLCAKHLTDGIEFDLSSHTKWGKIPPKRKTLLKRAKGAGVEEDVEKKKKKSKANM